MNRIYKKIEMHGHTIERHPEFNVVVVIVTMDSYVHRSWALSFVVPKKNNLTKRLLCGHRISPAE